MTKPNDVLSEAKTSATASESNVKLLDAELSKQKEDMTRLATELAAASVRIAGLESDAKTSDANLTTARSASQEAITALYDLEGKVTNLMHQVDDVFRTAVAAARLRVDRIHNPSEGAPQPNPSSAIPRGSNQAGNNGRTNVVTEGPTNSPAASG